MRLFTLLTLACVPLCLTAAPAPKAGPPRVLVVSAVKDGVYDIYLVQAATGETKNLTDDKAVDTNPVWSPDGTRIAFVSDRDGTPDIWSMKSDGTDAKQLTKKQGTCSGLKWSPDGSRIVFVSGKGGTDQIYTTDAKTGKVSQLTDGTVAHRQPAWSPDGSRLLCAMYEARYSTHTMTADGRDKVRLTDANGGLDGAWSPDGKRAAIVAYTAGPAGWKVFTCGTDGKGMKQLTNSPNTYGNVYPQFSPDGKKISFGELDDKGVLQVAVMGVDGDGAKVITKGPAMHVYTRWAPDGKSLSYLRINKNKASSLVVSDADGGDSTELIRGVSGIAEWKPK